MVDAMLRSIYSAADETVAQLDQLHRLHRDRVQTNRQSLDSACAMLGASSLPFVDQGEPPAEEGPVARSRPVAPEMPFVALPTRTTHGGDWGPAMKRKLIAEALAKDPWR